MITSHARLPTTSMAIRQSYAVMSPRAIGPTIVDPRLSPEDTRATARLRLRLNQRMVPEISGV